MLCLPCWLAAQYACNHPQDDDSGDDDVADDDDTDDDDDDADDDSADDDDAQPPPAYDVSLLDPGVLNHLLPLQVAVDPDERRVYSSSLAFGTIAEVDLDSGTLVTVHASPGMTPRALVMGTPGTVWLLRSSAPALQRFERATGTSAPVASELESAASLATLTDGYTVIGGATGDGDSLIIRKDAALSTDQVLPIDGVPLAMMPLEDATFAVLHCQGTQPDGVSIYNSALELQSTCPVSFCGNSIARLDSGDFVVSTSTSVGLAPCDGRDPVELVEGLDNATVVGLGAEALVLDRNGSVDLNWSEIRRYDSNLDTTGPALDSGKHSGYGGLDPATGLLWMNSEGTSELWAMDPATGTIEHKVVLGVHVESVAANPQTPSQVFVSGRLSDLLVSYDFETEQLNHAPVDFHWPVVPVVDSARGRLWVIDQLEFELYGLDLGTLEEQVHYTFGLGNNPSLTLSDMVLHPDRQTLLLTHGWANELVEVDPDDGAVLGSWPLGGDPLEADLGARLELFVDGSTVITARSWDGMLTRVDLDGVQDTVSNAPLFGTLSLDVRVRYSALSSDGSLLYVGPYAVDAQTLVRQANDDQSWAFAMTLDEDRWVAWDDVNAQLLFEDGQGAGQQPTGLTFIYHPEYDWLPHWDDRMVLTHIEHAQIQAWPLFTE